MKLGKLHQLTDFIDEIIYVVLIKKSTLRTASNRDRKFKALDGHSPALPPYCNTGLTKAAL